jgi:hypothetical protein
MAELQIRLQEATNSQQEDEENKRVHKNTIKVWLNVHRAYMSILWILTTCDPRRWHVL